MIRLTLPWPNKLLWPNGSRGNHHAVSGQKKKHRGWATAETWRFARSWPHDEGDIAIKLIVSAKPRGPLPDRDNCAAACKAYLDGIADALKVNDRRFAAPVVEYAQTRTGSFVIEVGAVCPILASD